jgi:hypothetical protein
MRGRPDADPNTMTVVLTPACGDQRQAARRALLRVANEFFGLPRQLRRVGRDVQGRPYLAGRPAGEHEIAFVLAAAGLGSVAEGATVRLHAWELGGCRSAATGTVG